MVPVKGSNGGRDGRNGGDARRMTGKDTTSRVPPCGTSTRLDGAVSVSRDSFVSPSQTL
jgi:hypothetical protein